MSRRLRPWVIGIGALNVVLAIALVIVLASRGPGGDATQAEDAPTPDTATSVQQTPQGSESSEPESATPTPESAFEVPEGALAIAEFTLPSGNIGCSLSESAGECWIKDFSYAPPGNAENCEWMGGVVVMTSQGLTMPCPDVAPGSSTTGAAVLEYGQSTAIGPWLCTSNQSGLECSSLADGTGFTMARATFTSYGPGRLA